MAKDPKEYGFEGEMVMSQLKGIMQHAEKLHGMLKPDTDLPEWVQSKITLAYDYIQTVADYMATEMSESVQIDEISLYTRKSYIKKAHNQRADDLVKKSSDERYRSQFPAQMNSKDHAEYTALGKSIAKRADRIRKRSAGLELANKKISEEAPANAVGTGKIAGLGVGPQGEPGVKNGPMSNYKRKNAAEAPKVGRKTFTMFMQGK